MSSLELPTKCVNMSLSGEPEDDYSLWMAGIDEMLDDSDCDLEPRGPPGSHVAEDEQASIPIAEEEEDDSALLAGIDEDDDEFHPPPSKMAKQQVMEEPTVFSKPSRFAKPTSSPNREKAARGVVPENTECSTRWALKNFQTWARSRSLIEPDDPVPSDLLKCDDTQVLCKWLCCFVLETRKEDGSPYPPSTLRSLVSGLNRIIKRNNIPFSVLDKTDHRFRDLLKTLDSVSSDLHRQGVGASRNSAPVIDQKDEDLFWEKGLLGYNPPKVLQRTVFFYIGLNFCIARNTGAV